RGLVELARRYASTHSAIRLGLDITAHSHTRITTHPACSALRTTRLSRARFRLSLARHKSALGPRNVLRPCLGHPCQKQPSTKTATLSAPKTRSGDERPKVFDPSR